MPPKSNTTSQKFLDYSFIFITSLILLMIDSLSLKSTFGYRNICPYKVIAIVPNAIIEDPTLTPAYTSLVPTSIPLKY